MYDVLYKEETTDYRDSIRRYDCILNSENKEETEEWYDYARDSIVD